MRIATGLAIVAAALGLGTGAAQAQQLFAPAITSDSYMPTFSAWTGFYAGAQISLLAMKSHENSSALPGEQLLGDINGSYGVFAGYRFQLNDWLVLGIDAEANSVYSELLYSGTKFGAKTWDAAVRAHLGYPIAPNVLAYGTVGYSFAGFDMSPFYSDPSWDGEAYTGGGFQFGLGVDMLVTDNLMARLEATYTHYGVHTITLNGVADGTSEPSDVVVRTGLGWKF